jgi:hypothetical protein
VSVTKYEGTCPEHLPLPGGQPPDRGQHLAVLLADQRQGLGGFAGRIRGRRIQAAVPAAAAQRRPAVVDHAGPRVAQRLGGVREAVPAPVEPAERLLHRVLGGGPVAEHDDGQPDQPEGVRTVQRGHGLRRARGRG